MEVLNYKDDPRAVLIHFNPNHDPRNGQFAKKSGSFLSRKFGKAKYENPDGTLTKRGEKRFASEIRKNNLKKKENRVKDEADLRDPNRWVQDDINSVKEGVESVGKTVQSIQDLERSTRKKPNKQTLDLSSLSDSELRSRINRIQMERQYTEMMQSPTTSKGRETVSKILDIGGKVLAVGSSAIGIISAIHKLKE